MEWLAIVLSLSAVWLLGKEVIWGWAASFLGSACWLYYGVTLNDMALMVSSTAFMALALRGYYKWSHPEKAPETTSRIGPEAKIGHGRCCDMSRKFRTGVIYVKPGEMPVDAIDFVADWQPSYKGTFAPRDEETDKAFPSLLGGKARYVTLGAKYCQWCGCHIGEAVHNRIHREE